MSWLLQRASLRFYLRHPGQLVLAIAGIGLGVGVYVGVDLANDSAARAFEQSAALLRGQTSHRLLPLGEDMDEAIYRTLVIDRNIATAAPVIEAVAGIPGRPGLRVPVLGLDPTQEGAIRAFAGLSLADGNDDLARLMAEPATVLIPAGLAADLGTSPGNTLTLLAHGRSVEVRVLGTVADLRTDIEAEPPILTDIATAQEMFGRVGRITRIDLNLNEEQAATLAAAPPLGTLLAPAEVLTGGFDELAKAFRTNLTALGLLALVVGTFLIYGTMSFAVLQRRATLGVLRALGVSRRELVGSVLVEGLAVAAIATTMGLLLGHWLAVGLVGLVLRTIGDLSFSAAVGAAAPSPWIYAQGAALGIGATLLAAARPALDAARVVPAAALRRAAVEHDAQRGAVTAAWAAVPLLAISGLTLAFGPSDLEFAFASLFGVLAAGALLTPAATTQLMRGIDLVIGQRLGLPAVLAVRGVSASLSRTGVATAALAVAVATVNGVGLMISSFRTSLSDWLDTTLTADLYVNFDGPDGRLSDPGRWAALEGLEGVAGVSLTRTVVVPTASGEIAVRAVRPGARGWGVTVVAGEQGAALAAAAAGRGLLASERLLAARGLDVGDAITLPSPGGPMTLPIVGGFRDFNTSNYSIVMSLEHYRRGWGDQELTGLGIDLSRGADAALVAAGVSAIFGDTAPVRVRSSAGIRQVSLEVFDRTFEITEVLRILAALVAFLGILSALLAIEMERARELGVLRALGFSPRQLATTLLTQTGLLGLAAGLVAIPLGVTLAGLLVQVINRRSFGWSMEFIVSWEPLVTGLLLAGAAALLAGIYPARRASRVALSAALREE